MLNKPRLIPLQPCIQVYAVTKYLSNKLVGNGSKENWLVVLSRDHVSFPGLLGLTLDNNWDTLLLGFLLQLLVGLHSGQKVLAALGVVDVLNTDINPEEMKCTR